MKALTVTLVSAILALGLMADAGPATAHGDESIYGGQMMTDQERQQHRDSMRSAESASERERLQREHRARMKARAAEKGVTLPDDMPGQGMGGGPGSGMGPSQGMHPGGMGPGHMGGMGGRGH